MLFMTCFCLFWSLFCDIPLPLLKIDMIFASSRYLQ